MREVLLPALTRGTPYELVGVCDTDPDKVASFRRIFNAAGGFTDHREMFDAVAGGRGPHRGRARQQRTHHRRGPAPRRPRLRGEDAGAYRRGGRRTDRPGPQRGPLGDGRLQPPLHGPVRAGAQSRDRPRVRRRAPVPVTVPCRLVRRGRVHRQRHHPSPRPDQVPPRRGRHHPRPAVQVASGCTGSPFRWPPAARRTGLGRSARSQAGSLLDARYPVERLELVGAGGNIIVDDLGNVVYHPPTAKDGTPVGATPPRTAPAGSRASTGRRTVTSPGTRPNWRSSSPRCARAGVRCRIWRTPGARSP